MGNKDMTRNADVLDTTQFLPEKWFNPKTLKEEQYPIVNSFRAAKGDLIENDKNSAQVRDNTIAGFLLRRGFLEEYHLQAATTLMEMRCALLNRSSYKLNSMMVFKGDESEGVSINVALDMLDSITRDIKLSRIKIIEYAHNSPWEGDNACLVIEGINVYRECFEALLEALQRAWSDRRKKDVDKYNASMQNDFSERPSCI
jgi:hypothetical protein